MHTHGAWVRRWPRRGARWALPGTGRIEDRTLTLPGGGPLCSPRSLLLSCPVTGSGPLVVRRHARLTLMTAQSRTRAAGCVLLKASSSGLRARARFGLVRRGERDSFVRGARQRLQRHGSARRQRPPATGTGSGSRPGACDGCWPSSPAFEHYPLLRLAGRAMRHRQRRRLSRERRGRRGRPSVLAELGLRARRRAWWWRVWRRACGPRRTHVGLAPSVTSARAGRVIGPRFGWATPAATWAIYFGAREVRCWVSPSV